MCNFYVYNWENANIKDLSAWRILMKFLCIYLGEGRREGTLMHVYILTDFKNAYYLQIVR